MLGNLGEANRSPVWGSSPGNQPQTLVAAGRLVPPVKSRHACLIPGKFGNSIAFSDLWFAAWIEHFVFVLAEKGGLYNQVMLDYKILPELEVVGKTSLICQLYLQLILFPALP